MPVGVVAEPKLRARVNEMISKNGTGKTSKALEVSPEALARVVGGLPVRKGTIAQVEKGLPQLEKRSAG